MSGPCDVRVGRYCYWRGDESDERPVDEPKAIEDRRDALLRMLDSVTRELPGDEWLAGQHVRYLVEAKRFDDALAFTARCRAGVAWCAALRGFAAHVAGRFDVADSAFTTSLAAMSDGERCRWLDLSDGFADDLAARFKAVSCDGRESFLRRATFLGAPLYMVSTTDLFTEQLARVTRARIAEHSASLYDLGWADDQRALVVRYGWPAWYTRTAPDLWTQASPSIVGHDAGMAYYFLPSPHALDSAAHIGGDDWHLDDPHAMSGYTPRYARTMHELPAQIAAFRRGDSLLVVAAWDARRDTTLIGRTLTAGLAIADVDHLAAVAVDSAAKARGVLSAMAAADSGIASVELLARDDRRAARLRVGVPGRTRSRLALSDILLYAPGAQPAYSLLEVRDSALAGATISRARVVGVFWETYGLRAASEPVHFTLSVERAETGWLRRAAERLHLADPSSGLRLQWDEVPSQSADGIAARGVRVDLTRLRPGRYLMRLLASPRDGREAVATREIVVP
jgi:hypothetical protein